MRGSHENRGVLGRWNRVVEVKWGEPRQMQAIVFAAAVVTRLQVSPSRHRSCGPKTSEGGK